MILVTGTSGALGGLIMDRLTAVPYLEVVAGTRAGDGVAARCVDFDRPQTLASGFAGIDVLVFVSAGYAEDDVVLNRHAAVIEAAAKAGVRHVIYTSLAGSGDQLTIALPHRWTEDRLAEAPFDVTVLRNGLYAELPVGVALAAAESAAATGVFASPWGEGRAPVVAREDLADVAARVAVEAHADLAAGGNNRHAGRTYELEGVTAIGGEDVAAALTAALGTPVRYESSSLGDMRAALTANGLLAYQVAHTVSTFSNINAGLLRSRGNDLPALLDAAPRPILDMITNAVKAGGFTSINTRKTAD
jgi:NAD(P)H dehydrogenase (quinone)